jgi:hypothetical protein
MRQIEDYFVDSIAQDLYHYTSADSLLGIAKSKALWASNVYFLNDSSEITHACDVLNDVLESRVIRTSRDVSGRAAGCSLLLCDAYVSVAKSTSLIVVTR